MKKQFFLLPLLAALAVTACTNDDDLLLDEPAATPENGEGTGEYGYIAVNIIRGNETGSRADNDNNFAYGTDAENEARQATFYVFDESGNIIGDPYTHSLTKDETVPGDGPNDGTADGNIERKYQVVLVIDGKSSTDFGSPKSIVCLLNAPAFEGITTLSDLKAKVDNYCTDDYTSDGHFVMSNAVYVDGANTVIGTPIKDENISTSSATALANPVAIHVERVVAKVNLQKSGSFVTTPTEGIHLDGNESTITLTPHITGIELANIAQTSYLLKNVDSNWGTTLGNWWNDATNLRSYWENIPSNLAYKNQTYNEVVTNSYKDNTITSGDVLDKLGNYNKYIQPNTNQSQKTAVLVTAELRNSETDEAVDFIYLRGGYFTPAEAKKAIATYVQQWGYYYKETVDGATEYKRFSPECFTWKSRHDDTSLDWLKYYEVVADLNEKVGDQSYKVYKWDPTKTEADKMVEVVNGRQEINNRLHGSEGNKSYAARYYNGGKCYYFVNIDQSPVAGAAVTAHTYDGVVRNHYYKLTLNGIKGLGTPVFDPDKVIIPEDLDDDQTLSYLAATVEVLSWKFVTQGVTFGE